MLTPLGATTPPPTTQLACRQPDVDQTIANLEQVSAALAAVSSIQEAAQYADVAKAATVYAREHRLGEAIVAQAEGVKLDALRRLGQLLAASGRAKGGKPYQKSATCSDQEPVVVPVPVVPTLRKLGINRKKSMLAQILARMPADRYATYRAGKMGAGEAIAGHKLKATPDAKLVDFAFPFSVNDYELREQSCADLFASGITPDLVIAVPPHTQTHDAYDELARACQHVPIVAVRVPGDRRRLQLPEIVNRLSAHLQYFDMWPLYRECSFDRGPLRIQYAPILLFCKDPVGLKRELLFDPLFRSGRCTWEEWLIHQLTDPGATICDPFLVAGHAHADERVRGAAYPGGTAFTLTDTPLAALRFGRKFIGASVEAEVVTEARRRIEAARAEVRPNV